MPDVVNVQQRSAQAQQPATAPLTSLPLMLPPPLGKVNMPLYSLTGVLVKVPLKAIPAPPPAVQIVLIVAPPPLHVPVSP